MVAVAACAVTLTGAPAAHASPSSSLTTQINTLSSKLDALGQKYDAMNISLQKTQSDLKTLQASLAPAKAALVTATAQVNNIAATAYEQGRAGPMSALLGGNSDDLVGKLSYLDQIQQSNQKDIDTYTTTTQTFAQRQATLKATQNKQAAQISSMAQQKKSLEAQIEHLKTLRVSAYGSPTETAGPKQAAPSLSGAAGKAVSYAYAQQGDGYLINAAGPNKFDCSGLTMMAWKAAGYSLPHNAAAQWGVVAHISRSDLAAGDLVFYDNLGHVGIYVGSNQIIDAPRPGELVAVRSINRGMPIYGYGRVT